MNKKPTVEELLDLMTKPSAPAPSPRTLTPKQIELLKVLARKDGVHGGEDKVLEWVECELDGGIYYKLEEVPVGVIGLARRKVEGEG